MIGPGSTQHSLTTSAVVSASCSLALATAERTTLSISTAARFLLKLSIASASSTARPRIRSMTSRALRGAMRANRCFAVKAISTSKISHTSAAADIHSDKLFRRRRRCCARRRFGSLAAAVTAENPRRGKFAQFVSNHIFLHEDTDELVAVVHFKRVPDELGNDRAGPRPGLQRLLGAVLVELGNLAEQLLVDEWTFFCASAHYFCPLSVARCPLSVASATDNGPRTTDGLNVHGLRPLLEAAEFPTPQYQFFRILPRVTRDSALGGHARLAYRMTAAVRPSFAAAQRMIDRGHRLGTRVRANAHVAAAASLAHADVDPVEIAKLANPHATGAANAAHFAGGQNHHRPLAFFGSESSHAARRANQLATLTGIHFDVVNFQTSRNVGQRHGVANFRRRLRT